MNIFKAPATRLPKVQQPAPVKAEPDTANNNDDAGFLFSFSTGADESQQEDKQRLQEQERLLAKAKEEKKLEQPVAVKTDGKRKRKAPESTAAMTDDKPKEEEDETKARPAKAARKTAPAKAGKTKKEETDASTEPTTEQQFGVKAKEVEKFLNQVSDRVLQKAKQKKMKPKPGDKYGLDRMDLFIRHYLKGWTNIRKFSDCVPNMAIAYRDVFQDIIKNDKLLTEVCNRAAEATVNEMVMVHSMITPKGQENTQQILAHLDSLPEEGEDDVPTATTPGAADEQPQQGRAAMAE